MSAYVFSVLSDPPETLIYRLQHDGEKDTRGPQDFAGSAGAKLDDLPDADDDDQDDDDDGPGKRTRDSKMKRGPELSMSNEVRLVYSRLRAQLMSSDGIFA